MSRMSLPPTELIVHTKGGVPSALRFNVSLFHHGKVVVPKLIEVLSALQNSSEYLALVYLYF